MNTAKRTSAGARDLRYAVAYLVDMAGGQRAFATQIGVSQSVLSRYLAGKQPLTLEAARGLHASFPGLREMVAGTLFAAPDMLHANDVPASAAS